MRFTIDADAVRGKLETLDLTQADLGDYIGTSGAMVNHYLAGRSKPGAEMVCRMARKLGTTAEAISPGFNAKLAESNGTADPVDPKALEPARKEKPEPKRERRLTRDPDLEPQIPGEDLGSIKYSIHSSAELIVFIDDEGKYTIILTLDEPDEDLVKLLASRVKAEVHRG